MRIVPKMVIAAVAAAAFAGCTSIDQEVSRSVELPSPSRTEADRGPLSVDPPSLEHREVDDHYLARIQQLTDELRRLQVEKSNAEAVAIQVRSDAATARSREGELAQESLRLQGLLEDAGRREQEAQSELIRLRLENVRLKQQLNESRIRELRVGAGGP